MGEAGGAAPEQWALGGAGWAVLPVCWCQHRPDACPSPGPAARELLLPRAPCTQLPTPKPHQPNSQSPRPALLLSSHPRELGACKHPLPPLPFPIPLHLGLPKNAVLPHHPSKV